MGIQKLIRVNSAGSGPAHDRPLRPRSPVHRASRRGQPGRSRPGDGLAPFYRIYFWISITGLPEESSPVVHGREPGFVTRISPRPVLFINGRWDSTVPRSAAALLHEAAGEPKQVLWADAGHILPPEVAEKGVEWLAEQLVSGGDPQG